MDPWNSTENRAKPRKVGVLRVMGRMKGFKATYFFGHSGGLGGREQWVQKVGLDVWFCFARSGSSRHATNLARLSFLAPTPRSQSKAGNLATCVRPRNPFVPQGWRPRSGRMQRLLHVYKDRPHSVPGAPDIWDLRADVNTADFLLQKDVFLWEPKFWRCANANPLKGSLASWFAYANHHVTLVSICAPELSWKRMHPVQHCGRHFDTGVRKCEPLNIFCPCSSVR